LPHNLLLSLLGFGGAVFMIPLLIYVVGLPTHLVFGTALVGY